MRLDCAHLDISSVLRNAAFTEKSLQSIVVTQRTKSRQLIKEPGKRLSNSEEDIWGDDYLIISVPSK